MVLAITASSKNTVYSRHSAANNIKLAPRVIAYDKAGNQIRDTFTGYGTATFDADNRIAAIQDKLGGSSSYTYNANAQRVRRSSNNQETWQIYGIDGELVAEYAANSPVTTPQKEYGYRSGQLLVTAERGVPVNVTWTNMAGVSVNGNSLTKTAATGWGNAGASSTQSITSGDGYVEVTATETTTARLFGFSHTDADQSWPSIDFGIDLDLSGSIYVFESGTNRGNFGPYATGDKFQMAIVGGLVKYKKNGTVFYTSSVTPAYPLVVDTALHANGSTLSNVVVSFAVSGPAKVQWLVPDHLGTPRIILDQTGSFANVRRHDYLPFGAELFAGTGGRTSAMGYIVGDGVRQQFTSKERESETGLDYFGARYYASMQGRFTSADEIWKDSHVADPQSWNKDAYARNNPLKFIDLTGEAATVTIETDEKNKTGKITVTASIALWTSKNNGISQKDLEKAAQEYKANIEKSWNGTYEQKGIKFEVSVTVNIQAYSSEQAATDSGAQNVLQVMPGQGHSGIRAASLLGGADRGEIALDAGTRNSEAAHEFTHILGVDDRYSGGFLSHTKGAQRAMRATAYDYGWAFGGAINDHRDESRQLEMRGIMPANPSGVWGSQQ